MASSRSPIFALLDLGGNPLRLGSHDLAESGGGFLAGRRSGRDHDLARDREGDRFGGRILPESLEEPFYALGGLDYLFGPGGALLL